MTPKEEFIAIFTENIKREGARELLVYGEDVSHTVTEQTFSPRLPAPSSTVPVRAVWYSIR